MAIVTCCGCIPLRTAAAAISLLWMLYSLIIGIWALTLDYAFDIILGILYLLICCGTMFGVYATFATVYMPQYVHTANVIATFFIILSIAELIAVIVRMHDVNAEFYCIKGTTICGNGVYGVYIPYTILVIVFSIYFAKVIKAFDRECSEEMEKLANATGPIPIPTIPVTTIPIDTEFPEDTNTNTVPMNTVPMNTVPMNTVPMNTVPMNTVPMNTVPVNAVPVNAVPFNAVPFNAVPINTVPLNTTVPMNSTYPINSTIPSNTIMPLNFVANGGYVPMTQPRASVFFTSAVPNSRITQYVPPMPGDSPDSDNGYASLVEVSDTPTVESASDSPMLGNREFHSQA